MKYKVLKNLIPKEFCYYLTHVLLRNKDLCDINTDEQVPNSLTLLSHDIVFETMHERLWNRIEQEMEQELIPTYAYARLYQNGNELKKHTDRPACEVSVTVQLGRSHHYTYPIYMEGNRIDLAEGDGVLYLGMEAEHWRDKCDGPDDYYSGQVFFHFVTANGPHKDQVGDNTNRTRYSYTRNRTILMEMK